MMKTLILSLVCGTLLSACVSLPKASQYGHQWDSMNYANPYATAGRGAMVSISPGMK